MKSVPRQIVEVEWIDSTSINDGHWIRLEEDELPHRKDLLYHSVGFVLHENDHRLVLALSVDQTGEDQANHVMAIPKVAILRRRTLKTARRPAGP